MELRPINNCLRMRLITLFLHKIHSNRWIWRQRKHPGRILLTSSKYCIKATGFTTLSEANAMQFVAQHTSIPVPQVYCSFEHKGRVYILMERVAGQPLSYDWIRRSKESQACILAQLKTMVNELRRISPPADQGVANVDGGPIFDMRLPDKSSWGPFTTIRDFHRELRQGFGLDANNQIALPGLSELVEFYNGPWPRPVFTHGDLSSLNIMALGDQITGIVDWETAGWMPSHWEYTTAWHVNPHNTFWREAVGGFLTSLPYELDMEKIRRQYFGEY